MTNEKDKELAHTVLMSGSSRYVDPTLEDEIVKALATVRREAFNEAIRIVQEQPSTTGDWMTQSDVAANLRRKIVWALERASVTENEGRGING